MASYSWVEFAVACPRCGEILDDVVWLPWGGVMSYDIRRGPVYRLGSRLLWHLDHETAPANTAWSSAHATNLGDPSLAAVDVFAENAPTHCGSCGARIAAVVVRIRDGKVMDVAVLEELDVDPNVGARVIDIETGEVVEDLPAVFPVDERP
jgi:hypothetical protein